ncbi:DUF2278 family protein [Spiroplasma melliferum]|uniref:DUF2278 domain-containing protein n=2 Tax=Spiroplasma melliferum TaxID=2134 RepID=A0AAI9X151_SPIME|nr:DUF2278 family protein [Spiroplasma melliferum]ELL44829.1 hypothetical protein SMIPMB4A_v3c2140 [Spiroplasma melliferum IPMB4A]KAI92738.1 hypothetical protein SPM_001555 [Spiroplasma melliferum KC3]QCO24356.1 hypothetical protein SRED_002850 [Spiroplasma melliferum]
MIKNSKYSFLKGNLTNNGTRNSTNPHYNLTITDQNGENYQININVRSRIAPYDVEYFIKENINHPIVNRCFKLANQMYVDLETGIDGYCIDYLRGNFFDYNYKTVLPFVKDDQVSELETIFNKIVTPALNNSKYKIGVWGMSYGNNDGTKGIHDIHMNQGNDTRFKSENGIWQDGAFAIYHEENKLVEHMIFIMFQSQCTNTDDSGDCKT